MYERVKKTNRFCFHFVFSVQCDAAKGMKSFFDMMAQKNKKIMMLFGAACTSVTDPIAKTSRFFELVQVIYFLKVLLQNYQKRNAGINFIVGM